VTKCTTLLAAALLTLTGLTVPFGPSAQAAPERPRIFPAEWCGNQAPPCVVAASRNGVAITKTDPTYAVSAAGSLQADGEFLTPFSITVDVGKHPPRVTDEYAAGVSVTDAFDNVAGTWDVTVPAPPPNRSQRRLQRGRLHLPSERDQHDRRLPG
jgi:hypothetical protein